MSFKLRFALRFTSVVAVILLVCFVSIYLLYASFREQDFYNRMRSEGLEVYRLLSKLGTDNREKSLEIIREVHSSVIYGEQIIMQDSAQRIFFSAPAIPDSNVLATAFARQKQNADYTASEGNRQYVGIRLADQKISMLISGIDEPGLERLTNLKLILIIVFGIALIVSSFISFLFSNQVSQTID